LMADEQEGRSGTHGHTAVRLAASKACLILTSAVGTLRYVTRLKMKKTYRQNCTVNALRSGARLSWKNK
jgi:hypothetical protein